MMKIIRLAAFPAYAPVCALAAASAISCWAQSADMILINGKVLTGDARFSIQQALAVRDGKIAAVGTNAEIRKAAGPATRTVDLGGRTMIPGLIDSHMHAIRAATTFSTEVNWVGVTTLAEALNRIRQAAQTKKPGAWIVVAGGWEPEQFKERRRPTQAELAAAAPNNPVYIQLEYSWVMMTPLAYETLKLKTEADLPRGAKFEKDAAGNPTGGILGGAIPLFDLLPRPDFDEQVDGTKKFFRELNRLGITGVGDPGGNNVTPETYQAIYKVWRDGQLTVRVAYSICGFTPGKEFEEYKSFLQLMPMGFGDDLLHFNGLGERVTWAMNNNNNPSDADKQRYYEIVRWAAERGMSLTMHWPSDQSVDHLLSIFERVNREIPIANLRWSIAHLNNASAATLRRMKALGVGWTVQDAMYFEGEQYEKNLGEEAVRRMPPVESAKEIGVPVGAGTDAHRVASYNPFTALQWFLDGKTVGGKALRGPEETPSRADALRFYTQGSAWFSHDENKRGSLEAGKLADLAVLSKDYMTAPAGQVGGIESLLTMVGGKIVYASGPFAKWENAR
jgi:predicted amidohydrolase YtcJ